MGADNLPSTHHLFLPGVYRLWAGHREDNCRRGRKKRDGEGAQHGEAPERGCKLGESGGNTIQLGQTLRPRPHLRIHGLPLGLSTPMTCHCPNQAVTKARLSPEVPASWDVMSSWICGNLHTSHAPLSTICMSPAFSWLLMFSLYYHWLIFTRAQKLSCTTTRSLG